MLLMRHIGRLLGDLLLAGWRFGRWRMAIVVPLLIIAAVAAAAKAAAPAAVYTLF